MALVTRWNGMALAGAVGILLGCPSVGCSAEGDPDKVADGAGGNTSPTGGAQASMGGETGSGGAGLGEAGTYGTGGADRATGGSPPGLGGSGTGGAQPGTGGIQLGTGGTQPGSGGSQPGTGGDPPTTGGGPGTGGSESTGGAPLTSGGGPGTGGAQPGSGGSQPGTGGSPPSTGGGPGTGGSESTGGAPPTSGGGPSTGGADPATGGSAAGGAPVDPDASTAVNECMDRLPWGARDMSEAERAPIVAAIIATCVEFAPPGDEWQAYCRMFLVAAINKESSYNVESVVEDAYGGAADPTVGLLQIRFSSTVREFADNGPLDALTRIGCDFGTVTSADSWATKRDMMLDPACNVALGAWYYFVYGSGNGGTNVAYVYQYCQGGGTAGTLHIGMASHLMGAQGAHDDLSGADAYYDQIKSWFDPCVTYSGTHPFERSIQPDTEKYCG